MSSIPDDKSDSLAPVKFDFKPVQDDVRELKENICRYKSIIYNPERFSNVEQRLFDHEFIDETYTYRYKGKATKFQLAAIYHILIQRNYFRKRDVDRKKAVSETDIRNFLDARYNVKLNEQFRKLRSEHLFKEQLEKIGWIDKILSC